MMAAKNLQVLPPVTASTLRTECPIAVLVNREGLGDVLLKLPLLRAIARGFPGNPIWWISTHQTDMAGPLRQFMPEGLLVVKENAGLGKPLREALPRLGLAPEFSLVFDTRTRIADVWLARHVLVWEKFFCCLPGYILSTTRPPSRFTRPRHIGERALSLAEAALGNRTNGSGNLNCSPAARDAARAMLPQGPLYVGLSVGSREPRKDWPLTRFGELSRKLCERGMAPVLLLGPREAVQADEIRAAVPGCTSLTFDPSSAAISPMDLTIAVAQQLAVVVANDSGSGHLFGAAGRPVVSLFGPTDPRRWAPIAPIQRTIWARDFGGDAMKLIPSDAVVMAIECVVTKIRQNPGHD